MRHLPFDRKAGPAENAPDDHADLDAFDLDALDLDAFLDRGFNHPAEQLTPSSGFVVSVMDIVHQHASEPPPLAFPWRRVVPGLITILSALVAFFLYSSKHGVSQTVAHPLSLALPVFSPAGLVLCWSACALCLSAAIAAAAFRFTNHDSW